MDRSRTEAGFTLVELMVGIALFAAISVGFYQVLFAASSGASTSQSMARVSEEARLGLNRIVRDTREARILRNPTSTSYEMEIDFDGDGGEPVAVPSDPAGSYEFLIVSWNSFARTVTLSNGVTTEVLMRDVDCIRRADNSCHDVFRFASSRLEYDTNGDGVASASELMAHPSLTNNNGVLDARELAQVDTVRYSFRVEKDGRSTNFYSEAQMRNFR